MTLLQDGFIEVDGLRLHYVEWGEKTATPMVLLHGPGDDARGWERFAGAMSAEFHVLSLDHRGRGESEPDGGGKYGLQEYVSDIDGLVSQRGRGGVVLVGHGEGGLNAIAYAARNPDKVGALVVVDSDLSEPDMWDEWRGVRCPALVARGRLSTVMTHEMAVRMREAAPRVRLAELEGGGHRFHQEMPVEFETAVRWFLESPPV